MAWLAPLACWLGAQVPGPARLARLAGLARQALTLMRLRRALTPGGRGPLEQLAARAAAVSVGILALLALAGASVRVLPWLIDPRVPWRMALPFGRAVASV